MAVTTGDYMKLWVVTPGLIPSSGRCSLIEDFTPYTIILAYNSTSLQNNLITFTGKTH